MGYASLSIPEEKVLNMGADTKNVRKFFEIYDKSDGGIYAVSKRVSAKIGICTPEKIMELMKKDEDNDERNFEMIRTDKGVVIFDVVDKSITYSEFSEQDNILYADHKSDPVLDSSHSGEHDLEMETEKEVYTKLF